MERQRKQTRLSYTEFLTRAPSHRIHPGHFFKIHVPSCHPELPVLKTGGRRVLCVVKAHEAVEGSVYLKALHKLPLGTHKSSRQVGSRQENFLRVLQSGRIQLYPCQLCASRVTFPLSLFPHV